MLAVLLGFVLGINHDCSRLNGRSQEGYSGADTLDIGVIYGPGGYYMYQDTIAGINKDIAEAFSKDNGVPVKLWPINEASEGMEKMEKGAFDILASLPLDNSIKKRFLVSESIFLDKLVLVQMADSATGDKKINSSLDLDGAVVYVAAGSSGVNRLKNLSEEIGGKIDVRESEEISDELLCLQVAMGQIPMAVVNERIAKEISKNYPRLQYANIISFTQFQVWLFNPSDSTIYNTFNSWFDNFRLTDSYRAILQKY